VSFSREKVFMIQLPDSVQQDFVAAGWHPGRQVEVSAEVPAGHPAWEILKAFGGLVIPEREPEPGWPVIEEFVFGLLTPVPAIISDWERFLHSRLVGIAEVHSGHAELYIDATGRCFGLSLMHDAFYFHGSSFVDAVEGLLTRRRSRPMLRPGQSSVMLYGERYTATSPELYRYS
jgi:hypothetical protein